MDPIAEALKRFSSRLRYARESIEDYEKVFKKKAIAGTLHVDFLLKDILEAIERFQKDIQTLTEKVKSGFFPLGDYQKTFIEGEVLTLKNEHEKLRKIMKDMGIKEADVKVYLGRRYRFFQEIPKLKGEKIFQVISKYVFLTGE